MTLEFSKGAEASLQAAHAVFAGGEMAASWDRLAETLARLESNARLFSELEGTPLEASGVGAGDAELFAMILGADPPGPAIGLAWALEADGGVTVLLIDW